MAFDNIINRLDGNIERQLNRIGTDDKVSIPMMNQPQTPQEMRKYLEYEDSTGYMRTRLSGGEPLVTKAQILLGSLRTAKVGK